MTRPVYLQQRTYVVTAGSPAAGADDPFFAGLQRELADKSFLLTTADNLITWARTGLADVDDVRARLLCDRDDADVDAALRRGAHSVPATIITSDWRGDPRGAKPKLQQDGACAYARSRAPTAVVTTTIPIRWCAAATASCRSISRSPAVRRPPKRCSTACCCCSRRFAAPAPSSASRVGR
jgi:hypothetical protein